MFRNEAIEIEGTVVDVLPAKAKMLYRVELANGHRLLGYPRSRRQELPTLLAGDKVLLEMSPFDFSKGRILKKHESI